MKNFKYEVTTQGNLKKSSFFGLKYEYITMPTIPRGSNTRIMFSLKEQKDMFIATFSKDNKEFESSITYVLPEGDKVHLCSIGLIKMFGEIPQKIYYKFY